ESLPFAFLRRAEKRDGAFGDRRCRWAHRRRSKLARGRGGASLSLDCPWGGAGINLGAKDDSDRLHKHATQKSQIRSSRFNAKAECASPDGGSICKVTVLRSPAMKRCRRFLLSSSPRDGPIKTDPLCGSRGVPTLIPNCTMLQVGWLV